MEPSRIPRGDTLQPMELHQLGAHMPGHRGDILGHKYDHRDKKRDQPGSPFGGEDVAQEAPPDAQTGTLVVPGTSGDQGTQGDGTTGGSVLSTWAGVHGGSVVMQGSSVRMDSPRGGSKVERLAAKLKRCVCMYLYV